MKIIKRNGAEATFDISKIIMAVTKANAAVEEGARMTPRQIQRIAESVELACQELGRSAAVEEIQDMVEKQIMAHGAFEVAKAYITYRYTRSLVRRANTTDDRILSLIECNNEEAKQENSNKNPIVNSTQRDYMAGEVSRDITNRILLPKDIVEAHEEGIIHFHDADYYAQHMHNCDLVNLEDMLENGTVITGTLIERPHSFSTACNIATQIIAQVASNQYGGQSISLTHLAPFVQVSRERIRREVAAEMQAIDAHPGEEKLAELVENRVREEIRRGVQTIQYQVVTLLTTNGQAPFVTVFMYLGEAKNEQERHDLAMIIEETLRQRYQGVKNEKGVWVTPAFPKLIYVLEEANIHEDSPYWYLTELAARCTAKRMVPDYISEKKMLELKVDKNGEGHCYTCMGCRSFLTPYVDENGKPKYPEVTRDVHVTGVLVSDNSVGWETSYYCFMDIRELRELEKEYKRVNKIRDNKNSDNNNGLENYQQVKVKVSDIDLVSQVDQAIKEMGFKPSSLDWVREPMQKQMQQQQLFLGSLAAISLLVAAIGITNTMIMSIYERTREIGVMKVLGCRVGNIRAVFLMEAGLIGFGGGLAGVGISLLISKLLNYLSMNGGMGADGGGMLSGMMGGMGGMASGSQLSIIPGWLIVAAIAFATVIGLISGFYPANRAVKISALEAIKHE